jgi:endonuclease III
LMYLKYLLGKTRYAPFDYHSEKVLSRLGLMAKETQYQVKKNIYNQLIGTDKPISRHRKLVEFSKLVCLERQPRCGSCPVSSSCQFNQKTTNTA